MFLCDWPDMCIMGVVSSARSLQRGEEAREVLESEGLHPSVLHLDVDSQQSIQQARDLVKEKYGRLDVLVNNAGVLFRVCKENWGCRWNWGKIW